MRRFILFLLCAFVTCSIANCQPQKTIGMILYKVAGAKPWDPESIKSGITGSEEAVIYVSQELAKIGYKVIVYGDPPKGSLHSLQTANPRYESALSLPKEPLDIAISWRMPHKAIELKKYARNVVLWPHDTYHWKLTEEQINGFDDVLWLSKWQRMQWISVNQPFEKFKKIYGNGIIPAQFKEVQTRSNPYSCIYGSNYARGLDILLDIWPNIKKQFPQATLDIYYGWQHWQLLTPEKEAKMRIQVAELQSLGVQDHGLVSHEELNRAFGQASFWTYPCTAQEVFCITAIRAQLAGAVPVIIKGSGLKETVQNGWSCLTIQDYEATLLKAMRNAETISLEERKKMGNFILNKYTWEKIAHKWHLLFEQLGSMPQSE
jgi:glycosyltransferase involved in cell wall biosynthesis